VILYDDDIHTFDEVITQLVKATGCTVERAEKHAWVVHTQGKDCVDTGEFFECLRVQGVLREIQLVTEIEGETGVRRQASDVRRRVRPASYRLRS
jgi:hypothetical protein